MPSIYIKNSIYYQMGKLGTLKEVFELFILRRKFYMLTKMGSQGGLFIFVGRKGVS